MTYRVREIETRDETGAGDTIPHVAKTEYEARRWFAEHHPRSPILSVTELRQPEERTP